MAIVPSKDLEALDFYEIRGPIWHTNAISLGVPTTLTGAIKANAVAARTAYTAQQNAIAVARAATVTWQSTMSTLRSSGSNGIAAIRATADNAANPSTIYALAQIPPPAEPEPLPVPGIPTTLSASILTGGALNLTWKMPGKQSGNTFYQVQRKLLGEGFPSIIGGSGNKSFTDETLPFGTDSVQYIVTAIRGSVSGAASPSLNVQFGVGGGGFSVATVKLAA